MKILVTGAGGLIGSEAVERFSQMGHIVFGIENDQRRVFFGEQGSTLARLENLSRSWPSFTNFGIDIRDREAVSDIFNRVPFDSVIHCAAQPSHDLAASIPFDDFETNALGTLNLLEAVRRHNRECVFVYLSTNKVYGDRPNSLPLIEGEKRYDFADDDFRSGLTEDFPIDQSKHSLFGASKLAADILVQEYGRYFGIPTAILRGGCLTGGNQSGVELHGFLNYLVRCNLQSRKYTIFGYKGKQVRDNIHAVDVMRFIELFIDAPRVAEVYNLGGGRSNSCSILEAFEIIENITGRKMIYEYSSVSRQGDHMCYYSDLGKVFRHYPSYSLSMDLKAIFEDIAKTRLGRS